MVNGVRNASQFLEVRSYRASHHCVRVEQRTTALRFRLLPLQRPKYHNLLPERGQEASILRDHQVARHALAVQVFNVFCAPKKAHYLRQRRR